MMEREFTVVKNINYQNLSNPDTLNSDNGQESDIFNKFTLDLFLPKPNSNSSRQNQSDRENGESDSRGHVTRHSLSPPVVMFVHGGGWRRGHKQAWMHYLSTYDTNLLMFILLRYCNLYENVGETFARNGVACAVVSYPLSRLAFPLVLIELFTSSLLSLVAFSLFVSVFVCTAYIIKLCAQLSLTTSVMLLPESWINISRFTVFLVFLAISQQFTWLLVFLHRRNYRFTSALLVVPLLPVFLIKYGMSRLVLSTEILLVSWSVTTVVLIQGMIMIEQIYRVPTVRHPQHVQALARAVKWLKQYGVTSQLYDSSQIFLMGHSAGGHLVTLVSLNEEYLQEEGCSVLDIKGVISISGIYDLQRLSFGLLGPLYVEPAFGRCQHSLDLASPIHYVTRANTAYQMPYLIYSAELDFSLLDDAKYFIEKLKDKNIPHVYKRKRGANHFSIIGNFGARNSIHATCISFIHDAIQCQNAKKSEILEMI